VPWDEVQERPADGSEKGVVVWTAPPPEGHATHFDVVYTPAGVEAIGHPGSRSMNTEFIGKVDLANGEQVFVVAQPRVMHANLLAQVHKLRSTPLIGKDGKPFEKAGMLAFGHEPNLDAPGSGTSVGMFLDVTRPTQQEPSGH
jgi:hypothetical protein